MIFKNQQEKRGKMRSVADIRPEDTIEMDRETRTRINLLVSFGYSLGEAIKEIRNENG